MKRSTTKSAQVIKDSHAIAHVGQDSDTASSQWAEGVETDTAMTDASMVDGKGGTEESSKASKASKGMIAESSDMGVSPYTPDFPQIAGPAEYKVGYGKPPLQTRFGPGVPGNAGGKPTKARNRLQGDFLRILAEDFSTHGKSAIIEMREKKPAEYVKVCASLMPKEIEVSTTQLDEMSDDQLEATLLAMRTIIDAQATKAAEHIAD